MDGDQQRCWRQRSEPLAILYVGTSAVSWLMISDGVHLDTAGYSVLWEEYMKIVQHDFKGRGIDPYNMEDLPCRVPWYVGYRIRSLTYRRREEIDLNRPESVIELMALPLIRSKRK